MCREFTKLTNPDLEGLLKLHDYIEKECCCKEHYKKPHKQFDSLKAKLESQLEKAPKWDIYETCINSIKKRTGILTSNSELIELALQSQQYKAVMDEIKKFLNNFDFDPDDNQTTNVIENIDKIISKLETKE